MRDAEKAAGAPAPKIHSLDDYFLTEVEKEVLEEETTGEPLAPTGGVYSLSTTGTGPIIRNRLLHTGILIFP